MYMSFKRCRQLWCGTQLLSLQSKGSQPAVVLIRIISQHRRAEVSLEHCFKIHMY